MHLSDVSILAMNGAGLVEGEFRLVSDDPEARHLVRPDAARIALSLGGGPVRTVLSLVGDVGRDPDGFYSSGPAVLDLAFEQRAITSLEDMLADLRPPARVEFRRQGGGVARVQARHPAAGDQPFSRIAGALDGLTVEAAPEDSGLRFKLEGEVGSMTTHNVEGPVLTRALITANVVVPWAYLRVQNSALAWQEGQVRQRSEGGDGVFQFGPTLGGVALNQFSGSPYLTDVKNVPVPASVHGPISTHCGPSRRQPQGVAWPHRPTLAGNLGGSGARGLRAADAHGSLRILVGEESTEMARGPGSDSVWPDFTDRYGDLRGPFARHTAEFPLD